MGKIPARDLGIENAISSRGGGNLVVKFRAICDKSATANQLHALIRKGVLQCICLWGDNSSSLEQFRTRLRRRVGKYWYKRILAIKYVQQPNGRGRFDMYVEAEQTE